MARRDRWNSAVLNPADSLGFATVLIGLVALGNAGIHAHDWLADWHFNGEAFSANTVGFVEANATPLNGLLALIGGMAIEGAVFNTHGGHGGGGHAH